MPWHTDIKSTKEYQEFLGYLNLEKERFGFGLKGTEMKKSLGNLLGAWGCTFAIEGKEAPNRYIMYSFNVWKKNRDANLHILLAEFVLGFCKNGPLADKGVQVQKFVAVNPTLPDRTYEHYENALRNAARAGVVMQTLAREVLLLRPVLEKLFEPAWLAFVESRYTQLYMERTESGLLGMGVNNGLQALRQKQKTKLEGKMGGLFGGSKKGQFLLMHEAKDGAPLLLLSNGYGTPISEKQHGEAKTLMSFKVDKMSKGFWRQTGNSKTIKFAVTADTGGISINAFKLALVKMDVVRAVLLQTAEEMGVEAETSHL